MADNLHNSILAPLQNIPTVGPALHDTLLRRISAIQAASRPFALFSLPRARHGEAAWWLAEDLRGIEVLKESSPLPEPLINEVWMLPFGWLANRHLTFRSRPHAFLPQVRAQKLSFAQSTILPAQVAQLRASDRIQPASDRTNTTARDAYFKDFARIQKWLYDGDLYQLNLTRQFRLNTRSELWKIWLDGYRRFAPPFAAWIYDGTQTVACLSPEELLGRRGLQIVTAPIKGTAVTNASELASQKNLAEHRMIVDLERNDFGQICVPGSVRVAPLQAPTVFGGIQHLVSLVHGQLQTGVSFSDLSQSLFPSGSVTGAPKTRVLQKIATLEANDRGYYCGALGAIVKDDCWQFCLPIRTATRDDTHIHFGSGGGIVADSTPQQEWEEMWNKTYWLGKDTRHARLV